MCTALIKNAFGVNRVLTLLRSVTFTPTRVCCHRALRVSVNQTSALRVYERRHRQRDHSGHQQQAAGASSVAGAVFVIGVSGRG